MNNKQKTSSVPACSLIIAMLIFAQIPILFGLAPEGAVIYALPWLLAAYPVLIVCIILMYKNGEFVDATLNALLSGVLMGQNFVRGIIDLVVLAAGAEVDPSLLQASHDIDKWIFLAGGVTLIFGGWIALHDHIAAGIGVWAGALGFICVAAVNAGFGEGFGTAGAAGIVIMGLYLFYTGISGLMKTAMGGRKKTAEQ